MGEHVLFQYRPGLWMLGEELGRAKADGRRARQYTVHNFTALASARAFCEREGLEASIEIDGQLYAPRAAEMLQVLAEAGVPLELRQVAHQARTSVAYARDTADRWLRSGVVEAVGGIAAKPGEVRVKLSPFGLTLAHGLMEG